MCPSVLGLNLTSNKIVKFTFWIFQDPLPHGTTLMWLRAPHDATHVLTQCFPKYDTHTDDKHEDFRWSEDRPLYFLCLYFNEY